jgi:hypothetical protein
LYNLYNYITITSIVIQEELFIMKNPGSRRPFPLWVLVVLHFFIGVGALISGAMLFVAPDGHLMQWNTDQLSGTPFPDYLVPGIILFILLGVYPLLVGYGLLRKPPWSWLESINPVKKQHWAWSASWAAGIIMLIWISVETLLLGFISFLQPVIAVYGVLIILLTLIPPVRSYYQR